MICTKNLATNFSEVPKEWIWSYYTNTWDIEFDGSNYAISSIFNKEKTPSMKLFFKGNRYWFKDFSSGFGGDEVSLVKCISKFHHNKEINYFQATLRILEEYNNWLLNNDNRCDLRISDFKKERKYHVEYKTRGWNELDKKYWVGEGIGSRLLTHFNVGALSEFTLINDEDRFTVTGEYIYSYFNNQGDLVKIYQPKVAHRKFIFVKQYLQGIDQLKAYPYLIIQSGLKDVMSFASLKLRVDGIAPDSENVMISPIYMKKFIKVYKQVLIMFDNDKAGHKATQKYLDLYPEVKAVYHCIEGKKDTTNIVSSLGVDKSRRYFVPRIDRVLSSPRVVLYKQQELL